MTTVILSSRETEISIFHPQSAYVCRVQMRRRHRYIEFSLDPGNRLFIAVYDQSEKLFSRTIDRSISNAEERKERKGKGWKERRGELELLQNRKGSSCGRKRIMVPDSCENSQIVAALYSPFQVPSKSFRDSQHLLLFLLLSQFPWSSSSFSFVLFFPPWRPFISVP